MADTSTKAQKLASARKKFKELKKEKKKNSAPKVTENADSTHTSRELTRVENTPTIISTDTEQVQAAPLPNYFGDVNYDNSYQKPAVFFDSFPQSNSENFFDQARNHETINTVPSNYFSNETSHFNVYNNGVQSLQQSSNLTQDPAVITSPSHFFNHNINAPSIEAVGANDNEVKEINHNSEANSFSYEDSGNEKEIGINAVSFDTTPTTQPQVEVSTQQTDIVPQYSSVESLRQLSDEMAELIRPNSDFMASTKESELELRNQELASLLNQEKIKNAQLGATVNDYQVKLTQLEQELSDKQLNVDSASQQEVSNLREELQCHIQTVGILVGEKAELSANLSQFQLTTKQKTAECEELQARLKASRSRVADLEREIGILKSEKSQFDNLGKEHVGELEKLSRDYRSLKEEREELMQDLLETKERFKSSSEHNLVLQQQLSEVSSQLSLANIKIQQLTTGEQDQASGQVEQLTQEKFALEKQIVDLNQTIKTLSKENEESNLQYQQYAQQLNAQSSNLASRLEQLQKENESLLTQEQSRIKHIGELEKQLQNLQNDHVTFATQRSNGEVKAELEASLELIQKLQTEKAELEEKHVSVLGEKEVLVKDLEARNETIGRLENLVEELRGRQPDNAKLLAAIESDKVAASRAVLQNTEMKKQLESMQEVFEKLNNDKVELTEKLVLEQRDNKDLIEKLQKTELHLQTLADAIEIKDKELCYLRENAEELNKQVLQREHLTDRLRHYEAHDHSSHSLQTELQEAKHIIAKMTEDLSSCNSLQTELQEDKHVIAKLTGQLEAFKENHYHEELVREDDDEVTKLRQRLDSLELKNRELEMKLNNANNQTELVNGSAKSKEITPRDNNHNNEWNMLDKESAMKHLEEKFLRTMDDIATLTDEKQRLEHLVLQLQSETETIGEYVALYQHQRSILKQKASEKDQQLTQLANDRELIKNKLEKLNELVKKLVVEKGTVTSELLQHHEDLNKESHEFCEEHARIHSEINKITENNLVAGNSDVGDNQSTETAEQIISLLSEIKSSNLVQPTENFHHCPWCSGQLITV